MPTGTGTRRGPNGGAGNYSAKQNDWSLPPVTSSMVTRDEADKASAYLDAACTTRGWTEDDREELVSMLGLDDPDFVTTPTISTSETNEAP